MSNLTDEWEEQDAYHMTRANLSLTTNGKGDNTKHSLYQGDKMVLAGWGRFGLEMTLKAGNLLIKRREAQK